jgi:predicted CopG family antitoxin
MSKLLNIATSSNYDQLNSLSKAGDSFNDVIAELLRRTEKGETVNNQNTAISFSTTKRQPIQKIFQRLPPYADCTGSYVSEILAVRFIYCCYCHMKSKDLIRLSQSVKADRNNRQAVTRYLNEMDKEEERLQGTTVSAQRQTAAASTSTLGEDTIEIQ